MRRTTSVLWQKAVNVVNEKFQTWWRCLTSSHKQFPVTQNVKSIYGHHSSSPGHDGSENESTACGTPPISWAPNHLCWHYVFVGRNGRVHDRRHIGWTARFGHEPSQPLLATGHKWVPPSHGYGSSLESPCRVCGERLPSPTGAPPRFFCRTRAFSSRGNN